MFTVIRIYSLNSFLTLSDRSFKKIVNKRDPRTDPCGTELVIHATFEYHFFPLFIRIPRNFFQVDINR